VLKYLLIFILVLTFGSNVYSQSARKKGDIAWEKGRYKTAVNSYSEVEDIETDPELLAKRGRGYFKLNKLKRAIRDFTLSKKLGNLDSELFFLMAQCKQHLGDYEEAAFFYKEFLKKSVPKSLESQKALRETKNCLYSATHQNDPITAFVENFGEDVNTYYDEVFPLQSPIVGNTFYFSSNRNLTDNNVYSFVLDRKGSWDEKKDLQEGINSDLGRKLVKQIKDKKLKTKDSPKY